MERSVLGEEEGWSSSPRKGIEAPGAAPYPRQAYPWLRILAAAVVRASGASAKPHRPSPTHRFTLGLARGVGEGRWGEPHCPSLRIVSSAFLVGLGMEGGVVPAEHGSGPWRLEAGDSSYDRGGRGQRGRLLATF